MQIRDEKIFHCNLPAYERSAAGKQCLDAGFRLMTFNGELCVAMHDKHGNPWAMKLGMLEDFEVKDKKPSVPVNMDLFELIA